MDVEKELAQLRLELLAIRADASAYQMLCLALIAGHPDRAKVRKYFEECARGADAAVASAAHSDARKGIFQSHFDAAYAQILGMLRHP